MVDLQPGVPERLASHREALRRYILAIVGDTAEAEDLVQETLLKAHRQRASLQDPASLAAWLYRIATNLCYDRFRRSSRQGRPVSLDQDEQPGSGGVSPASIPSEGPRLDKVMEQREMSACVQGYLADLPDDYRAAILLHDAAGMTNPEIARMLGVSLATVKIRIHRARRKLGDVLRGACSLSRDERGVLVCEPRPSEEKG